MAFNHPYCGGTHSSVSEARDCQFSTRTTVITASDPITTKQLDYIAGTLQGDAAYAATLTKRAASQYIDQLKSGRAPRMTQAVNPQNNRTRTIVPLDMLLALPDKGNYAVRNDSTEPFTFFRITRPKGGLYKNTLKIQTQHGENYKMCMTVNLASQNVYVYDKRWEDQLLLVVVDPNGSMIAYGQELGYCCVCSKNLTDERSRFYGIGPDCEGRHEHIIALVEDRKGPYIPGA